MSNLTRRESVKFLGGAAALVGTRALGESVGSPSFLHGVASGDPAHRSVVLWTRISGVQVETQVVWEVALDPDFRSIVASGRADASSDRDFTVKVVARGLMPGTIYHYRFRLGAAISPTGRARTLAVAGQERLGIALMSCTNYSLGYFNAYDAVASDPAIDFLLHTGDYYYEYGNAFASQSSYYVRPSEPAHETVTLADYRLRHATHKSDPQSQRMHAAHSLIALWDDHEFCNDSWRGGGENHDPATEGAWTVRRDAAVRAYYEWMPVRDPADRAAALSFWRVYRFGGLATLVTLEARLAVRDKQLDLRDYKSSIRSAGDRNRFMKDVLGKPDRRMLSSEMEAVLARSIRRSVKAGEPWRLIGNGTLLARILTPPLRSNGIVAADYPELAFLDKFTDLFWRSDNSLPDSLDSWDGYPAARQRFYKICAAAGARDLLALSGDSHAFWSNKLVADDGATMGVELGTAGITSPSMFDLAHCRPELIGKLDALYASSNPDVEWTDSAHRGYVRLQLTRDGAMADFVAVETGVSRAYRVSTLRTDRITRQGDTLVSAEI